MEHEMETGFILGIIGIRGFATLGVPFWGPHNKDYSIWGSILGYPCFGKLPNEGSLLLHFSQASQGFALLCNYWTSSCTFQHLHYGQALAHLGQEGQRKLYKSNMTVL